MTQLFHCQKCGYRNYVTREDIDARREEIAKRILVKQAVRRWWWPFRRESQIGTL